MADARPRDDLWRWILGGLAAGAVVLALMIAAYAIGYDRGQDDALSPATAPPVAETEPAGTTPPEADAVALGEGLWTSTGCGGCHTIDGTSGVGPTVKGLAGSTVELSDGRTVTADGSYLSLSITDPDAQVVAGYDAGIMSAATTAQGLDTRPEDVAALVAYMEAQR